MQKINTNTYYVLCAILCGFLFTLMIMHLSYINWPISGNPIIYNLCAKELSQSYQLSLNYVGIENSFYCNFHTILSSFPLALFYYLFGASVITSKMLNFLFLAIFTIYFFKKFWQIPFVNLGLCLAIWLSIPAIFFAFHTTDPDSNLGIFMVPVLYFYILDKSKLSLQNYLIISLILALISWNKELTGIICSLSLILSALICKNVKFFSVIGCVFLSWSLFFLPYSFVLNSFNLPLFMEFSLFSEMFFMHTEQTNSLLNKILMGLKGAFKWIGPVLFIVLLISILSESIKGFFWKNYKYFEFGKINIFMGLIISGGAVFYSGAHFPRYVMPFLFPFIVLIFYNKKFSIQINKNHYVVQVISLFFFFFFLLFVSKDMIVSTKDMSGIDSEFFTKFLVLILPIIMFFFYYFYNKKISGERVQVIILCIFMIIPNSLVNYFHITSGHQIGTQMQNLKGFQDTINYIRKNEKKFDLIFVDHIDLGFYLETDVAHLSHPSYDIPSFLNILSRPINELSEERNIYNYNSANFLKESIKKNSNLSIAVILRDQSEKKYLKKLEKIYDIYNYPKLCHVRIDDFNIYETCNVELNEK
jgi:hypothetical protein